MISETSSIKSDRSFEWQGKKDKPPTYGKIDLKICQELGLPDLCRVRLVCKEWKQVVEATDLWKKICPNGFKSKITNKNQPGNLKDKNVAPKSFSSLASLSPAIYEQTLLSFDDLAHDEIRKLLEKDTVLSKGNLEKAEKAYTQALKFAVKNEDLISESFCVERLGDIYTVKGTQETLLQAAGLYNYAFLRSSADKQEDIKEKLLEVENLLIKLCEGKPLSSKLRKKQFDDNRQQLKTFRNHIEKQVNCLLEDPSPQVVKTLYHDIAEGVKAFFKMLVKQSIDTLGAEPCDYAMIGFGSLAREEVTPYSDLEFGILIEEDTSINREYFKCLTTLIHLKVINLGETILPALNIPCIKSTNFFDDITPRGFAFDGAGVKGKGCKTPFGNGTTFELIQAPEKMAQYITRDEGGQWWHDKEPHLPMELLTFTHLLGKGELTEQYRQKVQENLDTLYQEDSTLRQYLAKQHLVQEDMETFNPRMGYLERQGMLFQVKNDFYRFPHLAIDRLALLKGVAAADTFNRINQLNKLKVITENAAKKLQEWMSITLFMRLKTYVYYKAQREMMNPLIKPFGFKEPEFIKQQLTLDLEAIEKVKKIYRIFIPFYHAVQGFLSGNEESLRLSDLGENSPQAEGDIALRLFQLDEAKKCYKRAIIIDSENTQVLTALGVIYDSQGNLDKAAHFFEKALKIDFRIYGKNHSKIERNYTNLGTIYHSQGNLEKAEEFAHKALKIATKIYNIIHPARAILYSILGEICRNQGDLKQACDYVNQALKIDSKLDTIDSPHVAMDYHNLGMIYKEQGKLERAAECINQALLIDLKLYGENHPNVATIYNTLATVYRDQMDLQKASECAKKSLDMCIKFFGEKHSTVASGYQSLGTIYLDRGKLQKATEYIKKALTIRLEIYGEIHSKVANSYNDLGMICEEQGNLAKAVEHIEKAIGISLKLFGENHSTVASYYNNLGQIYHDQGDLGKATEYIRKALAIDLKLFGENYSIIAGYYNNLGMIYQDQGNLKKAARYVKKALTINRLLFGEKHSTVAICYNNLGTIYKAQNNLDEAVKGVKKALVIDLKLFGATHSALACHYSNLGMIYYEQGKLGMAAECINQTLLIDLKLYGENHSETVKDYHNLGKIYKKQGNIKQAVEYTKKALRSSIAAHGIFHPAVAAINTDLQELNLLVSKTFVKTNYYHKRRDKLTGRKASS
ncbi:tetratricopeptide repeat protein [Neochlamydia sp. AcF65]|uniref:tetratricopeptide repeat protein n=1 Tax=Neochlamydia sp. AcF65 TaxID=2795735 RepID=UPI001BCA3921|nr:tetratricopeptide repeat protein [Neochlamydia sp. AcF65]